MPSRCISTVDGHQDEQQEVEENSCASGDGEQDKGQPDEGDVDLPGPSQAAANTPPESDRVGYESICPLLYLLPSLGLLGHDDPQREVDESTRPTRKRKDEKGKPDQYGIQLEIFRQSTADTGYHPFRITASQSLVHRDSCTSSGIRIASNK
mgnify:CR=1 FL=1